MSNVLAGPLSIGMAVKQLFYDTVGMLAFHLWNSDSGLTFYEIGGGSPGAGLDAAGMLAPGRSY